MRSPTHFRAALAVLGACGTASLVAGSSLAATRPFNGSFEGGIGGWRTASGQLSVVPGAASGSLAARVTSVGGASSFSIYPFDPVVRSSVAGKTYTATAVVRSPRAGLRLCLRIREWSSLDVTGSVQSCRAAATGWDRFPPLAYRPKANGDGLDVYVYAWDAVAGDSFDVDEIVLDGAPERALRPAARKPAARKPAAKPSSRPAAKPKAHPAAKPRATPAARATSGPLQATAVDNAHIRLDWSAVAGAAGYRVLRDGLVVSRTRQTTFADALLWPGTRYDYTLEALDRGGDVTATQKASGTTTALPGSGFQRPFPASSFWNTPIGSAPRLAPNSAAMISYFADHARNPNMPLRNWAVGVAEAHPGDPTFAIPCLLYSCTLGGFGRVPVPPTAIPDPSGDGHLTVYDPLRLREWDLYQARQSASGWTSGAGAAVSMLGNGIAKHGTASGNAANFPLLGGIVRPEEILQGHIDHALVFGMPGVGSGPPVCPASHNAGGSRDAAALREGQLLQLDPAVDVDSLPIPGWQKVVARAMQQYGMYLRDGSGTLAIGAENSASRGYDAWAKVGLPGSSARLGAIPWDRFRVIAAGDC